MLIKHYSFFYAEQSKDVISSEIHYMLNGPGWSRRGDADHADWYTVLTDRGNHD